MKYKILPGVAAFFFFFTSFAQNNPNKAFAIVSNDKGRIEWMNIKEIDLSTGQVVRSIFEKDVTNFVLLDATTKKKISRDLLAPRVGAAISTTSPLPLQLKPATVSQTPQPLQPTNGTSALTMETRQAKTKMIRSAVYRQELRFAPYESPTSSMVAAMAYDKRHNKLFFTPMRFAEIRWIDLDEKGEVLNVYCLTGKSLYPSAVNDEANHITRMVIASDGYGYALSNDSKHLFRFTTGKKVELTDLGEVNEGSVSAEESIYSRNNWGGDMIADAKGNLYIIASNHGVFKIDVTSRSATMIGKIEGLPKMYTTNGAGVDVNGNLIVSSANSLEGYYKVNLETLQAEKQESTLQTASCSDLATGFLAFSNTAPDMNSIIERNLALKQVSVYPNPVTRGHFKVDFSNYEAGQYDIQMSDLNGKIISQKRVRVGMSGQSESFSTMAGLTKGLYLVKIVNSSKQIISSGKILLQ